ncbi:MAG: hypothetical protein CVU56_12260 [Deltaproteobacteria bacterium HGW-Deltaproteobacteria-14]|jgi:hypothetical protein|nr:MAG: hypothetical protein CVU56_12260 [Deltaproteobacteria bacterium HGW-Deltaproteobacteria-14]
MSRGIAWAIVAALLAACGGSGEAPPGQQCLPSCAFKACGDDGCGGVCGSCPGGYQCAVGQCVAGTVDSDADTTSGAPDTSSPVGPSDSDQDLVDDRFDNCVGVYNPDQADADGDHRGDPCDNDIDGDGVDNVIDCAPTNKAISQDAAERCGDGIDNNCDGVTDGEDSADCTDYFVDGDRDGAGATATKRCLCAPEGDHRVLVAGDCDDADTLISPLVAERCNGQDDNCNLLVDEGCDDDGDGYCDAALALVGTPAVCPNGGGDCYDYSALVSPAMVEIPGDGLDNDCDGIAQGDGGGTPIEPSCAGVCTGSTVDAMLCGMEMCYPDNLLSASIASPTGDNVTGYWTALAHWGAANNDLVPYAGASYAILGTGLWSATDHEGLPSFTNGVSDPYSTSGEQMFDAVELRLILRAPAGATGFSLDYIFMSAEYEEFIGSQYNDKFYIVLKAPQTTANQKKIINFTNCSNPGAYHDFMLDGQPWCYIAINTAFSEPCTNVQTNINGTWHQCPYGSSTGWLSTSWPIQPNEQFELTFHIHDTADDVWDSHVVIDNFRWEGGSFEAGTISHH